MFAAGPGKPRAVFLKIAAKDCPACTNYDPKWTAIKEKISKSCNVEIKEINQNQKFTPIKQSEGPLDLNNYATKWYPCFVLVSGTSWAAAQKNAHAKLDCEVFNGKKVNGNMTMINPNLGFSEVELVPWINQITNNSSPAVNAPVNNPPTGGYCEINQKYKPIKF